ncbi:hypothetical protein CU669_16410 [Paramagnetospirillum kuznetsovii]|uniref:DUF4239 domain-containing protein n=1 Tax=Paramagnetospirillum kuznetsovii TaxID=2053833 RepID=A0A364NUW5_9PROT|nr:DUF4239 domain-containing protein [Paramagnetospirillum kuznetsovii]RAU20852.1 hypothetical protein CU669_16410 [Paramagnetospirillum kuznetsovii]
MLIVLTFPLWMQALLTIGGALAVTFTLRLTISRLPVGPRLDRARDAASALRQPATAFVALTLAMSGVEVINEYHRAGADAGREAGVLERLYRDSEAYGGAEASAFSTALVTYVRAVIDDEWAAMQEMHEHPGTKALFDQLFATSHQMHAADSREQIWLNDIIGQLNLAADLRRARISHAQANMPWIFYMVAIGGSMVVLCYASLLPPGPGAEPVLAGYALVIGLTILLVVSLDLPFSGTHGVKADDFKAVLENICLKTSC